jgi:hypothetical protein
VASVLIAALLVVAVSASMGRAICILCGWHPSFLAPAAGFAALLVIGGAVQYLPGDALTAAVLVTALSVAALWVPARVKAPRAALVEGAAVVVIVLLLSSIPLFASGRAGILGAGNQNDMVQHLTTAHWLDARDSANSVLVRTGYPLGPHGLAALVAHGTGMSLVHAFDGVTLAIPVLTALAAFAALGGVPRPHRLVVASMSALCYLAASYLATGAFKETAEALFLLAFVLALRELRMGRAGPGWRAGVPVGILIAGTVYTYSYLGVIWLVAAAGMFGLFELAGTRGGWRARLQGVRVALPMALGGLGALVVLAAPQSGRMIQFSRSSFAHQAVQGTGNLLHAISPVQALGVWLRADFRFTMPPGATLAVGLIAGAAALLALVWWLRKRDFALPAGVISAALVYWLATENKNVYNQAKALAITAPLLALMVGAALAVWSTGPHPQAAQARRTLVSERARLVAIRAISLALLFAAAASSFLALRDGPVSADAHASDLAPVRNIVRGQPTLNMDQDDFSHWYLPGVDLGTGPLLYPTRTVPPRRGKPWRATEPFDFDSWSARNLNAFGYVIEPRTEYRSATPPGFRLIRHTRWFYVWKRVRKVPSRSVLEHGGRPGRMLDCGTAQGRRLARQDGVASVMPRPVVRDWRSWRGQPRRAGQVARMRVRLPRGHWDVSLQYVSTMGLDAWGPGLRTSLPAHLGRIGPYWYVGTIRQRHDGRFHMRFSAQQHGLLGRVLGARGFTRAIDVPGNFPLQGIAFTRHGARNRVVPLREACGRYVDWYRLERR